MVTHGVGIDICNYRSKVIVIVRADMADKSTIWVLEVVVGLFDPNCPSLLPSVGLLARHG